MALLSILVDGFFFMKVEVKSMSVDQRSLEASDSESPLLRAMVIPVLYFVNSKSYKE